MIVSWSPCSSMPKPATGLPVAAIPSTTFFVHCSSMPMTTTAATLGLRSGADQRAEVQVEVRAELQAAVGVGQRHRALDVVRDRLRRGVGEVVDGQDDHVIAYADAAVLAP